MQSPEIAAKAARIFDARTPPERSCWVTLETEFPEGETYAPEDMRLIWVTEENGQMVRYDSEPMTDFWERIGVDIFSWFVSKETL